MKCPKCGSEEIEPCPSCAADYYRCKRCRFLAPKRIFEEGKTPSQRFGEKSDFRDQLFGP